MPQIFHPSMNTIARTSIFGFVLIIAGVGLLAASIVRSPYVTEAGVVREQPVPFSHEHHVGDVGIDCRYCHSSVETSAFAGMPSTSTCMNCHAQLWNDAAILQPVRSSFETGEPIEWTRVHDLPDFVYFNHSIHVAKGVACASCHGDVSAMPLMWREATLHMQWCLDCHRDPTPHVVSPARVFDAQPMSLAAEVHREDEKAGDVSQVSQINPAGTDCYVCHR